MLRPLICVPLAALLTSPNADNLALRDTAGASTRCIFSVQADRSLASIAQFVNGEDATPPGEDIEQSSSNQFEVAIIDRIDKVEDGVATLFTRTFESIEGEVAQSSKARGQTNEANFDLISDLSGHDVQFRLDEGEWIAEIPEGSEADAAYLPGLVANLNFSELLPAEEVAEGDEWEVSLDFISTLTRPGGELGLHPEEQEDFNPGDALLQPERSGSINAKYQGPSEDDPNLGVIQFEVDVVSTNDLASTLQAQIDASNGGSPKPQVQSAERISTLKGSGTVHWGLNTHRLHTLELDCESEETIKREMTLTPPQGQGSELSIETSQVSIGSLIIKITQEGL